jgi:hypothetical protein
MRQRKQSSRLFLRESSRIRAVELFAAPADAVSPKRNVDGNLKSVLGGGMKTKTIGLIVALCFFFILVGGSIYLRCRWSVSGFVIEVEDDGVGMAATQFV